MNIDAEIVSEIILGSVEGKQAVISSVLMQDFQAGTSEFNIKFPDGGEYRVTIKVSKL